MQVCRPAPVPSTALTINVVYLINKSWYGKIIDPMCNYLKPYQKYGFKSHPENNLILNLASFITFIRLVESQQHFFMTT